MSNNNSPGSTVVPQGQLTSTLGFEYLYASRSELIGWVNRLLDLRLTLLEQVSVCLCDC
jgi:hypothetical protein